MKKNFDNKIIKQYTKEQVKQLLKQVYLDFYSGKSCNFSIWEFNELYNMISNYEPIDLVNNTKPKQTKIRQITFSGKLKTEKCPICHGKTKLINNSYYCNNSTCKFWYDYIFNKFVSYIEDKQSKQMLKLIDSDNFQSISTIINQKMLSKLILDNISDLYNLDIQTKITESNDILKSLENIRNILNELYHNTEYFDMFSRHLKSYIENLQQYYD